MAFLSNDAINRVNLHSGIQALAESAGAIFILVYLVRADVPVPVAFLVQAAIMAGRFVLRPAMLPLARRWGVKPMLIVGTLGMALQYPVLAQVDGLGGALVLLIVVASVGEVFYYLSYNAYFAVLGDAEHRGHQIGARQAIMAASGVVAPILGAWALVTIGPGVTFAAVGLIQASAVLPLLRLPNVPVRDTAPGIFRQARLAVILIALDGCFDAAFFFVWQVALFLALSESIAAYGGAMALSGLVGALAGLVLGRWIDTGRGQRTVVIAFSVTAMVVILRAFSLDTPWLAIVANALGGLVLPLIIPPLAAATYNLSKASRCSFRFQMLTEGSWDVACFVVCLGAAAVAAAGYPLIWPLLIALPAAVLSAVMLWHYHGRVG